MSLLAVLHHACETADIAWTCPQTLAGGFVADAIPHSQGAGCSSACFEWSRSGRLSHEVCPFYTLSRFWRALTYVIIIWRCRRAGLGCLVDRYRNQRGLHSETLHKLASRTRRSPPLSRLSRGGRASTHLVPAGGPGAGYPAVL